jgi:hypothetical protein
LKNEKGNAKALLRYAINQEKKWGTFRYDEWVDWCRQYGVKA